METSTVEGLFRSNTQSVSLSASPRDVHAYVSDAENLPEWAPGFAPKVTRENDGRLLIQRGEAKIELRIISSVESGVVDFGTKGRDGTWSSVYSRVVPNGNGSEYSFTLFQLPGMPDEVFDQMVAGMGEELAVLKNKFA